MPQTGTYFEVFALNPVATGAQYSTAREGRTFDHLLLFVDFTLGSLTSVDIEPQVSLDGATWWDVYDANGSQVTWNLTGSVTYARYLGPAQTTTRMHPITLAAPLWRIAATGNGTSGAGSTLDVDAVPFVLGAMRD